MTLIATLTPWQAAWSGGRNAPQRADNPFRLTIRQSDYQLQMPGNSPGATAGQGKGSRLTTLIDRHAKARGLDPALVHAVVQAESAYRPTAVSPKGAMGLMQVMPDTGRRFGVQDLLDPDNNLEAGTAYLSYLLDLFNDVSLALAAYNAGEGAVIRHGNSIPPYRETRAYVHGILRTYDSGRRPDPRASVPGRQRYGDGLRQEKRDMSPYRLRKDPWRDSSGQL